MRKNLYDFLFGSKADAIGEQQLGEQVISLFEDAEAEAAETPVVDKKPLTTALKEIGVKSVDIDDRLTPGVQWCDYISDDEQVYKRVAEKVFSVEGMTGLAERGWVPMRCGETSMSGETPQFKIGFIEITTVDTSDSEKAEQPETIRKQAQEKATDEFEREEKDNPVEIEGDKMGGKREGVGEPADGKAPTGKPKGSTKQESAQDLAKRMFEMTGTGSVPPVTSAGFATPMRQRETDPKKRLAKLRSRQAGNTI